MLGQKNWEYASMEWLWQASQMRCNLPSGEEIREAGSYAEVVKLLTRLGADGWDVASCVAGGDWIYWTLKREV